MFKHRCIAVFGAAHMDTLATVAGFSETVDRPGRVVQGYGGTGYNLALALAGHGLQVRFGIDLKDGLIERLLVRDLRRRGIDTDTRYHQDFPTAGFCAHVVNGDLQAAVSATPIESITLPEPRIRAILTGATAVVADCNHSVGTLKAIQSVARASKLPFFVAGVSESKALKIADIAPGVAAIFVNRREAYYLLRQRYPDLGDYRDLARHLQTTIIVTRDTDGAAIVTATDIHSLPSPLAGPVPHYLGTGDALMAAALEARLARNLGWPMALQTALAALAATVRGETCNASTSADMEAGLDHWGRYGQVDAATGLPNRVALREAIDLSIQDCACGGHPFTVWFVDVAGFKAINDTYGHVIGDQVLAAIGRALRQTLPMRSLVARFGGDEFAGMAPMAPEALVTRLQSINTVCIEGQTIPVAVNAGAVAHTVGLATADVLIAEADRAMYAARHHHIQNTKRAIAFTKES